MTIKEVCEKYNLSADTLRYYERVGVIPEVSRTPGGIRDYGEVDLGWVENAVCMRDAGVPVEMLIEYVKLYQEGNENFFFPFLLLIKRFLLSNNIRPLQTATTIIYEQKIFSRSAKDFVKNIKIFRIISCF